jgi:predicted transcriptional regulator
MDNLIIKVGADKKAELKAVFDNPKLAQTNTHTLFLDTVEDLYEILSPKRFELLRYLINHHSEIADELKRKQEAISRDAALLYRHSLINKSKDKKRVYLEAIYRSLNIQIANQ